MSGITKTCPFGTNRYCSYGGSSDNSNDRCMYYYGFDEDYICILDYLAMFYTYIGEEISEGEDFNIPMEYNGKCPFNPQFECGIGDWENPCMFWDNDNSACKVLSQQLNLMMIIMYILDNLSEPV